MRGSRLPLSMATAVPGMPCSTHGEAHAAACGRRHEKTDARLALQLARMP